ncbi:MAG: flagellar hook protein FlgE [Thermodesulfobacteriota bacterium]|nr:flagellar hook protein FlgE [Thermodesulfobacteriota bacterium]
MIGSLFSGISGLTANSTAMSAVGDNIANVNTPGYKGSRPSFANILSQSMGGSQANQIGRGVKIAGVATSWSPGSVETTDNSTDLSIGGEGLFVVKDGAGTAYYTRAGEFSFDKDGNLVNPDGLIVQGYAVDSAGTPGAMGNVALPLGIATAQSTSMFTLGINLDAVSVEGDQYTSSLTVYDSLGNDIPLTMTFTKTANTNEWSWEATAPAAFVGEGNEVVGTGSLTFNEDGTLPDGTDPELSIPLTNGATTPQAVAWDLYDDSGVTNGGLVQYASPSSTISMSRDGYAAGTLQSISVDEKGLFSALYTNGVTTPFSQIALADFPSYAGLAKIGDNLFSETLASGSATLGLPSTGGLGAISSSSLEMSNVNLVDEFVKMITSQRAFQANSRVITTSDEILAELINIKR